MEKQEKITRNKRRQIVLSVAAVASLLFVGTLFFSSNNDTTAAAPAVVPPKVRGESEEALLKKVQALDKKVRDMKKKCKAPKCLMETDKKALAATKKLQDATRLLLAKRYGAQERYRVLVDLEFQETMQDYDSMGPNGSFVIEMGPVSLVPYSVYMFMEIARNWKAGAFNRNADHVLQVYTRRAPFEHLAFQEYNKKFPHKERTLGFAGRPSSKDWYISIEDNTENHGPGTQQDENPYEADSCFGRIVDGYDDTVQRIKQMGGASGRDSFVNDEKFHVLIKSMHIMVPGDGPGGYVFWKPSDEKKSQMRGIWG